MRLGFLTACLPSMPIEEIVRWASANAFSALEVAAWPDDPTRQWEASHVDVVSLDAEQADRLRYLCARQQVRISALAYYENNLDADVDRRRRVHDHLRQVIDAAALLRVDIVGTFVGRDTTLDVADNLRLAERELPPLVQYAADRGVRLVVENCPMEGWHPDGYPANLAYSPELWDWLLGLGFYLNFDPSHLAWLGIDPVAVLPSYADRILHVQAKDVEVDPTARNRYGVFGRAIGRNDDPWSSGWWRYRIPGLGDLNWSAIIAGLGDFGYDGVVSVEHEDPVWSGDAAKVQEGLRIAHRCLAPLVER